MSDNSLSFSNVCKTVYYHLWNISLVLCEVLSSADSEKIIHAFVTSMLDCCNSVLAPSNNSKELKTQLQECWLVLEWEITFYWHLKGQFTKKRESCHHLVTHTCVLYQIAFATSFINKSMLTNHLYNIVWDIMASLHKDFPNVLQIKFNYTFTSVSLKQ